MEEVPKTKIFFTGGFFYNPKNKTVLLHKRDDKALVNPNQWGFFGGTSEGNETPIECFIREIKEELSVDLDPNKIKSLRDYLNEKRNTWRYVYYVENDLDKSKMILGEGEGFDWIPLSKVFDYDLTEKTVADLKYFISKIL